VEQTTPKLPTIPEVKISEAINVWQIGHDGSLTVGTSEKEETPAAVPKPAVPAEQPVEIPATQSTSVEPEPTPEHTTADVASSPGTTEPVLDTMQISAEAPEAIEASSGTKKPIIEPPTKQSIDPTFEAGSPKEGKEDAEHKASGMTGAAQALADSTSATRPLDDALETLAASADGKRESDGQVHDEE
jgi:hypothetical protein